MSVESLILQDIQNHARAHNTQSFVLAYDEWDHTHGLGRVEFANVIKELQITNDIKVDTEPFGFIWLVTVL